MQTWCISGVQNLSGPRHRSRGLALVTSKLSGFRGLWRLDRLFRQSLRCGQTLQVLRPGEGEKSLPDRKSKRAKSARSALWRRFSLVGTAREAPIRPPAGRVRTTLTLAAATGGTMTPSLSRRDLLKTMAAAGALAALPQGGVEAGGP